ncbi:unnamed protein product [Rodentolepis nana]|uniref:Uncharacterized protein n=1 Tax=Rodentolepis nana TaxID=102285 RepID=A0A0R3TDK1_RODNA|nr:unnamed protein product [Rodentolepis nana]
MIHFYHTLEFASQEVEIFRVSVDLSAVRALEIGREVGLRSGPYRNPTETDKAESSEATKSPESEQIPQGSYRDPIEAVKAESSEESTSSESEQSSEVTFFSL